MRAKDVQPGMMFMKKAKHRWETKRPDGKHAFLVIACVVYDDDFRSRLITVLSDELFFALFHAEGSFCNEYEFVRVA